MSRYFIIADHIISSDIMAHTQISYSIPSTNLHFWFNSFMPMIYSQNIRKKFSMKFRGIFPNNVTGILFVEYLWNIPMTYSQNIRKKLPMKFGGIFRNNVQRILNIGIFPNCSMNILQMLHAFF